MTQICAVISAGCDRQTASGVAYCTVLDIAEAIDTLPTFAARVRYAEATAELRHMENILRATKDGKYWRASVWWLERHSPERFARRAAGAITPCQLGQAVDIWNDAMQREFATPADQKRLSSCLETLTASFELILDAQGSADLLKRHISRLQLHHDKSLDLDAAQPVESKSSANAPQS